MPEQIPAQIQKNHQEIQKPAQHGELPGREVKLLSSFHSLGKVFIGPFFIFADIRLISEKLFCNNNKNSSKVYFTSVDCLDTYHREGHPGVGQLWLGEVVVEVVEGVGERGSADKIMGRRDQKES